MHEVRRTQKLPRAKEALIDVLRTAARSCLLAGRLVSRLGNDFGNCAAWGAELHWNPGVADYFTAVFAEFGHIFVEIVHLDGKVVDAWSGSRSQRFSRFFFVIFDEREINSTIAQVTRGMVPDFSGFHILKTKKIFVKLAGLFQIIHFQRYMNDAGHVSSLGCLQSAKSARKVTDLSITT